MTKSKFGKGLTYCLGMFLAHTQDHRLEEEGVDQVRQGLAVELWFYGAADHLFEMELPIDLPRLLRKRLQIFRDKVLQWRLPGTNQSSPTEADKQWAINEAVDLLRLIDKHYGIKTEKARWL